MILEELSPASASEWDAFVDAHPLATCYHLRAWQRVAEVAYGLDAPHLIARARPGGPIRGVLPLFIIGGPLGRYVATGLFGAYGHILTDGLPDDADVTCALLEQARRITRGARARYLLVKTLGSPSVPSGFERRDTSVIATLRLAADAAVLWKGFKDKQRNCIRKAQKSGFEHRTGSDQLAAFYDVLAGNMHRKGTPIYGFAVMRELALGLGDRAEVHTLWKDGQPVSGALSIHYKGTFCVPFASSRHAYFKLNPNNLIYWEMIQRACALGCASFDFGRSTRDSSTLAFKLTWGAVQTPQPFYIYTARGKPPSFDADDATVKRLANFWMSLPRPVADALGPTIYRNFLA